MVDGFWEGDGEDMSFEMDTEGELANKKPESSASAGGKSVNKDGKYHCMLAAPAKKEEPVAKDTVVPLTEEEKSAGKPEPCPYTSPSMNLMFNVLAGDHEDQKDLKVYLRLYLWEWNHEQRKFVFKKGKKLESIGQIAYGLGMITAEEFKAQKYRLNFSEDNLPPGRQCVLEVRNDPYKDNKTGIMKDSFKVPYGNLWKPDSAEVKDVPKDAEAMSIYISGAGAADTVSPNLF